MKSHRMTIKIKINLATIWHLKINMKNKKIQTNINLICLMRNKMMLMKSQTIIQYTKTWLTKKMHKYHNKIIRIRMMILKRPERLQKS